MFQQKRTAAGLEAWAAAAALLWAVIAAGILLLDGGTQLTRYYNVGSFFASTILGPLVGFAGAWMHARRGEALGLILLGLAVLLTLNGIITLLSSGVLLGVPCVVLVTASFVAAVQHLRSAAPEEPST